MTRASSSSNNSMGKINNGLIAILIVQFFVLGCKTELLNDNQEMKVSKKMDEIVYDITLQNQETAKIDEYLTIRITDITEKWLEPDRTPVMRIGIMLITPEENEEITLFSDDPSVEWNNYEIEYIGGWRSEATLKIKKQIDRE